MSEKRTHPKQRSTLDRIDEYQASMALLQTWEAQPDEVQAQEHEYLKHLRAKCRQQKQYITHRSDPKAHV